MFKSTLAEARFAFRRLRYSRENPNHPTSYGKMWQANAGESARKIMCEYFGVKEEVELTQTIIDNYTSSRFGEALFESIIAAYMNNLTEVARGALGLDKFVHNIKSEHETIYGKHVGYLPIRVGEYETVIGVTGNIVQTTVPLFYPHETAFSLLNHVEVVELDDGYCNSRSKFRDQFDKQFYEVLMRDLSRFWINLHNEYFSRRYYPRAGEEFKLLLSPDLVMQLTGYLPSPDSVLELTIIDGNVNALNEVYIADSHRELRTYLSPQFHLNIVSKLK